MPGDPICGVCGEPRSAHVETTDGPLSHPREARGEGRYELARPEHWTSGNAYAGEWDDVRMPAVYRFVAYPEDPTPNRQPASVDTEKEPAK
jgi:hypothetical protein